MHSNFANAAMQWERAEEQRYTDSFLDVVENGMKCPECGENRIDYLAAEENEVTCHTCGTHYKLELEPELVCYRCGTSAVSLDGDTIICEICGTERKMEG